MTDDSKHIQINIGLDWLGFFLMIGLISMSDSCNDQQYWYNQCVIENSAEHCEPLKPEKRDE